MDISTYNFNKNTLYKETMNKNIPKELTEVINELKGKGFILKGVENPQIDFYSKVTYDNSFYVELFYDFGEKYKTFLLITILKNQWTDYKIEWWIKLDEVMFKTIKGNSFQELSDHVNNLISNISKEMQYLGLSKNELNILDVMKASEGKLIQYDDGYWSYKSVGTKPNWFCNTKALQKLNARNLVELNEIDKVCFIK